MKAVLFLVLCSLLWSTTTMAAPTSDQRRVCKESADEFANTIVRTKGKGRFSYHDAATVSIGEQVWNSMLLAYERNPQLSERQLAILGNSTCLAKF